MTIGIYKLTFPSGAFYIGQSVSVELRFINHKSTLITRRANEFMQLEYDYCGEPIMTILEECTLEVLNEREKYYIDKFNAIEYPGLNIVKDPTNHQYGEDAANSKYSNDTYEKIFKLLLNPKLTTNDIATSLNVSSSVVRSIAAGTAHIWLKDRYPKEYEKFMSRIRWNRGMRIVQKRPTLQAPDGSLHDLSGKSVNAFAKAHGLTTSSLTNLLNGYRITHKGWKIFQEA